MTPTPSVIEYHGPAYRHCNPLHTDLFQTLGHNRTTGGRFHPPNEFGALYVSLDRSTVTGEMKRRAEWLGLSLAELFPRTLLSLRVQLHRVLDLTDSKVRQEWRINAEDLAAEDFRACQTLARRAREGGHEAILYPSATGRGENAAIFLDQLRPGSSVEVESEEPLKLDRLYAD